jgi:hypothetical protein
MDTAHESMGRRAEQLGNRDEIGVLQPGVDPSPTSENQTMHEIAPPPWAGDRQEFWLDTCRDVTGMHVGSAQVRELNRKHGCRFDAPTGAQVRGILEALDAALPQWDREHPELFFQTLELSFPQLLHRH